MSSENPADCEAAAAQLRSPGGEAQALACDVSQKIAVEALVSGALQRYGRIDTLVCNAGIAPHIGPIASASDSDWVYRFC